MAVIWKARKARGLAEGLSGNSKDTRLQASWHRVGREGAVTLPEIVDEAVWYSYMVPQQDCVYPLALTSLRV